MELLKRIQALLERKEVTATFDGNDELMFFALCESLSVRMQIRVTDKLLTVRGHFPMFVPAHRRLAMCEAISLINWSFEWHDLNLTHRMGNCAAVPISHYTTTLFQQTGN